ncbi:hypothetical protein DO97_06860 [Neosynechococcus sphagnicola sy1]|uniref:Uncharacterized protein n=1 Tax=Neosynechococcus sphagnicola sy1 TaxID=1497020 RepID=A0A098TJX7_9CYAN|nr:hypothetical protein [Neosynechococcus sphagnicola]KGF72645.1 hypothetical protein DO97_06860 [Neosynechococcus sphagnicola sy1]
MVTTEFSKIEQGSLFQPYVELSFAVIGETLPADHGYGLYSAIALNDKVNLQALIQGSGRMPNEQRST